MTEEEQEAYLCVITDRDGKQVFPITLTDGVYKIFDGGVVTIDQLLDRKQDSLPSPDAPGLYLCSTDDPKKFIWHLHKDKIPQMTLNDKVIDVTKDTAKFFAPLLSGNTGQYLIGQMGAEPKWETPATKVDDSEKLVTAKAVNAELKSLAYYRQYIQQNASYLIELLDKSKNVLVPRTRTEAVYKIRDKKEVLLDTLLDEKQNRLPAPPEAEMFLASTDDPNVFIWKFGLTSIEWGKIRGLIDNQKDLMEKFDACVKKIEDEFKEVIDVTFTEVEI